MNRIFIIAKIKNLSTDAIDLIERTKKGEQEHTAVFMSDKMRDYVNEYYSIGDDIAIVGSMLNGFIEIKEVCRY